MDRKVNPLVKHKWRSQPDLVHGGAADIDMELHKLCLLSGVRFNMDVFRIIVDLLRLNVNPNTLLDVLRKIATQSSMQNKDSSISSIESKSKNRLSAGAETTSQFSSTPLTKHQKNSKQAKSVSDLRNINGNDK